MADKKETVKTEAAPAAAPAEPAPAPVPAIPPLTLELDQETLEGLQLIADAKKTDVQTIVKKFCTRASKAALAAKAADEKREEILAKISDEIDEMSEKKKELLTRIKAVKIDPDLGCEDWDKDVRETAKKLFENVWIYTFGVGALCASKMCSFSKERLSSMLTTEFKAMMMLVKSGGID